MFYVNLTTFFLGMLITMYVLYRIEDYLDSKKTINVSTETPRPFINGMKDDS